MNSKEFFHNVAYSVQQPCIAGLSLLSQKLSLKVVFLIESFLVITVVLFMLNVDTRLTIKDQFIVQKTYIKIQIAIKWHLF